jgi:hypothetical protein
MKRIYTIGVFLLCSACWSDESEDEMPFDISCGNAGCQDMLTLALRRFDGEAFPPGDYNLELTPANGDTLSAICTVYTNGSLICDQNSNELRIELSTEQDSLTVRLNGAPLSLEVKLSYGAMLLTQEQLVPKYNLITPNGPTCEPSCLQGSGELKCSSPNPTDNPEEL